MPLNDLVDKYRSQYQLDDISAKAWAGSTIDGKIYGVPVVGNILHLAYRPDLFEKYNLAVPTTNDDVIKACEALKAEPGLQAPFALDVSAGWAWELEFFHFLGSYGGSYLNADNTPAFNTSLGVEAATKLKAVVDACMGDAHLSMGYEANEVSMRTGTLAFTQIWGANTNSTVDPAQSQCVDVIKFAPAPAAKPGGPLAGSAWNDYYSIPATTLNDTDLLFRMIMEVADVQSMQQVARVGIVTRSSIKDGLPNLVASSETVAKGSASTRPARPFRSSRRRLATGSRSSAPAKRRHRKRWRPLPPSILGKPRPRALRSKRPACLTLMCEPVRRHRQTADRLASPAGAEPWIARRSSSSRPRAIW